MSRVITFSRTFPSGHPRKGDDTYFVEQILNYTIAGVPMFSEHFKLLNPNLNELVLCEFIRHLNGDINTVKGHTIRKGNRWRAGDKFSPRVWSGKPYRSKMITIDQDIEIKKIWEFEIDACGVPSINQNYIFDWDEDILIQKTEEKLAKNDGLSLIDMHYWFIPPGTLHKFKGFKGQIICWDESIEY